MSGSLSSEIQFNPNQRVMDEIISSGKLGLFSNPKLKFALSSWDGLMQNARLQELELQRLRFITIDIIRNEANLRKAIYGPVLQDLGIKQSKFIQGNLSLLQSLPFEGHMMGIVTMSISLNHNEYLSLNEHIDRILLLIDDELE